MDETTLFEADGLVVTSHRLIVPGTTYAMDAVAAIRYHQVDPSTIEAKILIGLGVLAMLAGRKISLWLAAGGLLAAGLGYWWLQSMNPMFHVELQFKHGGALGWEFRDEDIASRLVSSVNESIVGRYR